VPDVLLAGGGGFSPLTPSHSAIRTVPAGEMTVKMTGLIVKRLSCPGSGHWVMCLFEPADMARVSDTSSQLMPWDHDSQADRIECLFAVRSAAEFSDR